MPKISVIMPVYNTNETYLREAIESILNQTYSDFEFIIVDDGSKNNVEEVVKSYDDSRIRFYKNEKNLGINKTNNIALKLVTGEYIARMDSDDIAHLERFAKQVEFLDNNPEVGVLGASFMKFGKREEIGHMPIRHEDIVQGIFDGRSPFVNATVMMRTSLFDRVKYSDEYRLGEDLWLWAELIEKTKFANLNEIFLKYRWHGKNSSKIHTREQSLNTQKIIFNVAQKHKGIDCSKELLVVEKLLAHKSISGKEFKEFISKKGVLNYNKVAYKTAKKSCRNLFYKFFG